MSNMKNSVRLIGHVGQDPEIRLFENGRKMAKFSLATNERYTNSQGVRVEKTEWHNMVLWNAKTAIVEKYVAKGSHLIIDGSLATRSWEDQDGIKRYRTEIVVRDFQILDRPTAPKVTEEEEA